MQYKEARRPLPEIAGELKVDAIVEGSVHQAENRVRITAQLIHGATDEHLWANSFEREIDEILTLQSDLALAIAREIQVEAREQERLIGNLESVDPEAYRAYLRGLDTFQNEGAESSIRHFEQAVDLDPDYAPSYAWLAYAYAWEGAAPGGGTQCSKARIAARKAGELDETLSEAHSSLGYIMASCDWDWDGAEGELKSAIDFSPNSIHPRDTYRLFLTKMGRFDEALDQIAKMLEVEPLSPLYRRYPAVVYYFSRRHEESILELQRLPELRDAVGKPMWRAWPLVLLAQNYGALERREEALATCAKLREIMQLGASLWVDSTLAQVYARAGKLEPAQEILNHWTTRSESEYVDSLSMASMYTALDQTEKALECLAKGYETHQSELVWLKVAPALDPLRSDPRFQDLLRRMNFPE
jgi:tetratricopeptide (TPR) repeat protein